MSDSHITEQTNAMYDNVSVVVAITGGLVVLLKKLNKKSLVIQRSGRSSCKSCRIVTKPDLQLVIQSTMQQQQTEECLFIIKSCIDIVSHASPIYFFSFLLHFAHHACVFTSCFLPHSSLSPRILVVIFILNSSSSF